MTRCAPVGRGLGNLASGFERLRHLWCDGLLVWVCCIRLIRKKDVRGQVDATVGDGGDHGDELNRCYGDFLADGDGADGGAAPALGWLKQSAGFAGEFDAGAGAEAEGANVLIEAVVADFEREFDGGDVAGSSQSRGDGDDAHAAIGLVVVDDAAGKGDLAALAVDRVVGRGHVLVERGGVGDELEDGAWLVDIADGVVLEQLGRGVAKVVGIEGGSNGESENLAGVHVLHDDGSAGRLGPGHGAVERASRQGTGCSRRW